IDTDATFLPRGTVNVMGSGTPSAAAPTITGPVNPTPGPTAGGTLVTLTGMHFVGATAVFFGSQPATAVTVISDTQLTALTPAAAGTVDVTVTTPAGTSATTALDQFPYVDKPTATIDLAATQGAATNAAPIHFTVVFNERVTDFGASAVV